MNLYFKEIDFIKNLTIYICNHQIVDKNNQCVMCAIFFQLDQKVAHGVQ
jgi:hypothetical protein